jgi:LuxR family maltose regulon positive regulatory protein
MPILPNNHIINFKETFLSVKDAVNPVLGTIYRETVIKKMNKKSAKRNLFITAPGGYGKTTVATQWLSFVRGMSAQLKLGNEDNNPGVFYKKLILTINKLIKKDRSHPVAEFMLDTFLEMLKQLPDKYSRCYLLIDDLHIIKNNDILNSLPLIAGRLPSYICLCLVSRSMPSDALLETGLFTVLTKDDLLFSLQEVEWLGAEKDLTLTGEQINDLLETTGGWAMYLSALLSGDQLYKTPQTLLQYLETRVWNVWDDETRKILVQLAVPFEITPDLCERLTGYGDGAGILDRLVKKEGVFLSPSGNGAYHFHDIFRDFLLDHASLLKGNEISRLNDAAAKWYCEQRQYFEGARHYIRNRDHEGLNYCLSEINRFRDREGTMSVEMGLNFSKQYISSLPEEFIVKNPYLISRSVGIAYNNGDVKGLVRYADMLYKIMPEIIEKYPNLVETVWLGLSIDYRITFHEFVKRIIRMLPQMVKHSASGEARISSITQNLPFIHRSFRDFSEYYEKKDVDIEHLRVGFHALIGEEYDILEQALFAGLDYEHGELIKAVHHALNSYHACTGREGLSPETVFCSHIILAYVLFAMDAQFEAKQIMAQVEDFIKNKARYLYPNFKALQTERALRAGEKDAAREWLAVYANNAEQLPFYQIYRHYTTLRSYLALGDYQGAVDFGRRLQKLANDYNRPLDKIESGILTAVALWKSSDARAENEIEQALLTAMPYGFEQLFINESKEILPLLWMIRKKAAKNTDLAQFVNRISQRISGLRQKELQHTPRLSTMRRKMLVYLNTGMTYKKIADNIGIVHGTAKRHILLLYKQLGVNCAEEAIIKAKMLGLLE